MYSKNNVDLQHKKKMSKIKISDKTLNKVAFVLRLQIEYILSLLLLCVCVHRTIIISRQKCANLETKIKSNFEVKCILDFTNNRLFIANINQEHENLVFVQLIIKSGNE